MSSIKFTFSAATDPLAPCRFWMILLALAICDDAERRKRQEKDKKAAIVQHPPRGYRGP